MADVVYDSVFVIPGEVRNVPSGKMVTNGAALDARGGLQMRSQKGQRRRCLWGTYMLVPCPAFGQGKESDVRWWYGYERYEARLSP
jgi:hypothetical protein